MSELLKIGEAARLAGVTPKAIRHYHKVGLLAEPRRSEGGYRLYGADELLRLGKIRRLRNLGLSLDRIAVVLGKPEQERLLREVLGSLLAEVSMEMEALEERKHAIEGLLDREDLGVSDASGEPLALRLAREHLGEHLQNVSEELWEQERRAWATLEDFEWPEGYLEEQERLTLYYVDHPDEYRAMISLGEQLAALADVPENSPQVERLAREYVRHFEAHPPQEMLSQESPWSSRPLGGVFAELFTSSLSPAQRRVMEMVNKEFSKRGAAG